MSKFKKFERKIRKYRLKLAKIEFKEKIKKKLKRIVENIGISKPDEFKLIDESLQDLIFPCHLGITYSGKFEKKIFHSVVSQLEIVFTGFFYNIVNLDKFNFSKELLTKGVKKETKKFKGNSIKLDLHPTNKFYQILIDKRTENRVNMIIAITNLPIFSSDKNNIIFLFGEANIKHHCCVVSSLLLKERFYKRISNYELFIDRISKEIIHEIGHLILGTNHCSNGTCVMRFSKTLSEIDIKNMGLCNNCQSKLAILKNKYNF